MPTGAAEQIKTTNLLSPSNLNNNPKTNPSSKPKIILILIEITDIRAAQLTILGLKRIPKDIINSRVGT